MDALIEAQKEEIDRLKETEEVVDIKEFYFNKYHEMYQEILRARKQEIDEAMKALDAEIQEINHNLHSIEEDLELNENIKQKQASNEEAIYELHAKMEEARFQTEIKMDLLQKDTRTLYMKHQALLDAWFLSLDHYLDHLLSNGELIDEYTKLFGVMNQEGFTISVAIKESENKNAALNEELNQKIASIRAELDTLLKEKTRLENRILDISDDHKASLEEDLRKRMEYQKNYELELTNAFQITSSKQLKELSDLIIKYQLVNKSAEDQIAELDILLEKDKMALLSLDTKANLELQKGKRKAALQEELNNLEQKKQQLSDLDQQTKKLKGAYQAVIENIEQLDSHLKQVRAQLSTIEAQGFLKFDEQYQKDLKEKYASIVQKQKNLESYREDRTYHLFDPDPAEIATIDQQIHTEEMELNALIHSYDQAKRDYECYLAQENHQQIKDLIEEGFLFENELPKLKQLTIKLKEKILSNEKQMASLNEQLVNYQDIVMQIEELSHDDYN